MTKKEFKKVRIKLLELDESFAGIGRRFHTSRQMVWKSVRGEGSSDLAKQIRAYVDELLSS